MPNNILSVSVDQPKIEEKDILKWRHNKYHKNDKYLRRMIVRRGQNKLIGGLKGTYFGEWQKLGDKPAVPHGCGLHVSDHKVILGRLDQGKWIETSRKMIIDNSKRICKCKITRRIQNTRPNAQEQEVGLLFGEDGLVSKGVFDQEGNVSVNMFKQPAATGAFLDLETNLKPGISCKVVNEAGNYTVGEHN